MTHVSGNTDPWADGEEGGTPIDAAALERIEDAIDALDADKVEAADVTAAVEAHEGATDPHGDRAYAAALVDDLSGVSSPSAARTALGLGTAATHAHGDYATAAQGTDARTPTAHAASHADGGTDELTLTTDQITALAEYIRDTIATALTAGANVTITPNDGADTITIAASGGGGSALTVKDEGSNLDTAVESINFTGPGVTATNSSHDVTATISGFWEQPTASNHVVFPPHSYYAAGYSTQNEALACRVWLKAGTVYKGLSARASVAGSGCTLRAAVYTDSGTGAPSTLVSGTEVSASISGTAVMSPTFGSTWTVPSDGWYWLAVALDGSGSAPTMHAWQLAALSGTATGAAFPARGAGSYKDLAYSGGGALNSTFAGSASGAVMPMVQLVRN